MSRPIQNGRAAGIKSSPSMAVSMAARRMAQEGRDVIDLSQEGPDSTRSLPSPRRRWRRCAPARRNTRHQGHASLLVAEGLSAIPGLKVRAPEGAFYADPEGAASIGRETPAGGTIGNDTDLAAHILEADGVATVPGSAFGLEPYIRLSFAASRETLRGAISRTADALAALS